MGSPQYLKNGQSTDSLKVGDILIGIDREKFLVVRKYIDQSIIYLTLRVKNYENDWAIHYSGWEYFVKVIPVDNNRICRNK